jgi:chemotaxis protein MotB
MMALFLVLWLVSQADTKLKQAIANYFRSPGVFDSMDGGILAQAKKVSKEPSSLTSKEDEQALFGAAETLQKQFSTRPEFSRYKEQVKIEVTEEGLRIQLIDKADRVSFQSGSATLSSEAETIIKEIAAGICSLPNKINIGGHTDSNVFPSETGYSNWELSTDRANAARRILEAGCVKPDQIRRIVGFADTEPMDSSNPFSPANRRISITVLRLAQTKTAPLPADEKKDSTVEKTESKTEKPLSDEQRTTNKKLQSEGAVTVGEADVVPNKPKIK